MPFDLKAELLACLNAGQKDRSAQSVRGGNAGIVREDGTPIASDSGSCPRTAYLRSHGIQGAIDFRSHLTFSVGFAFEALFEKLRASKGLRSLESQVPVSLPIAGSSVPFEGTADFVLTFHNGYRIVADTKSVSSLRSFHSTFVERKLKLNYVAQLVSYMEALGIGHGLLVAASFIYVPKDWMTAGKQRDVGRKVEPDITVFDLRLAADGTITIDGQTFPYTLADIHRHRQTVAQAIETNTPPRIRPVAPEGGWNPCGLCPFANACAKYEALGNFDAGSFLKFARET